MRKSVQWSKKEDELILSNITLIASKKWKRITNLLKKQGFEKKQTECRERYINHLSLSLDKSQQVSNDDLCTFYQKYEEFGPRWTQIQQYLPKISQVELKNIFYGNIRCFIKKIIKYFTNKTAVFVNKFNTFTLQNMYSAKKNYKDLKFIKEDLKKMKFRFNETQCFLLIEAQENQYRKLFTALLEEEEMKKSKNYCCFTKVNIKNSVTLVAPNALESNDPQIQVFGSQLHPYLSYCPSEINPHNQNSYRNNSTTEWPYSQFSNIGWNGGQNFYMNEPSFNQYMLPQFINFYQPVPPQLFFQSYSVIPSLMNTNPTQKNIFSCNQWN